MIDVDWYVGLMLEKDIPSSSSLIITVQKPRGNLHLVYDRAEGLQPVFYPEYQRIIHTN